MSLSDLVSSDVQFHWEYWLNLDLFIFLWNGMDKTKVVSEWYLTVIFLLEICKI